MISPPNTIQGNGRNSLGNTPSVVASQHPAITPSELQTSNLPI
ncbi:hypothetical protein [Dickeya zeae]|nr:hypothetical protein [Dickeya zeae]